jgi:parallel beta-helix repeat protein
MRLTKRYPFSFRQMFSVVSALFLSACATDISKIPIVLPQPPQLNVPTSSADPEKDRFLHADNQIQQSECTSYDPRIRRCGNGSGYAYRTLGGALQAARPGDTVIIRQGQFSEPIATKHSGTVDAPIIIRNYKDERVVVSGLDEPVLKLKNRYHIIIEGLHIDSSLGWGRLEDSAFITLRNNRFTRALARGTTGGLKLVRSHYNRIQENTFERGNDSVVLQESDRNLIVQNIFTWARHSLLSIRCSNFNVIRGNRFDNKRQKAMEIYDCQAISDAPYRLDATKRNLVEYNHFTFIRNSSRPHKYNAIQYAGQYGIVRRNFFYDNQGGGINVQVYSHEALYNYGHRIYHNTFYANKCYAFTGDSDAAPGYGDIILVNNLFFKNLDCRRAPEQIGDFSPWAVIFAQNGVIDSPEDPLFVSPEKRDLRLKPGSPMIDQGSFLTRATGDGAGTLLPVQDVKFFYDGFGIHDEAGDEIQLAGSSQRARIVSIDYQAGVLQLDRSLTWKANQGVATAYEGKSPDFGADESTEAQ